MTTLSSKMMTGTPHTSLSSLLSADRILALHDSLTRLWHEHEPQPTAGSEFLDIVTAQHQANFELWHIEDQARAPRAADHQIAEVKRAIDRTNQRRNDLMESCDTILLTALAAHDLPSPEAELHSESPGLILDRLSILSLKIFHTREQIERTDAPPGHAGRNRERLLLLELQRNDLANCLDRLWKQVIDGQRRFKLYRQLKMYNDPDLNPAMYRSAD